MARVFSVEAAFPRLALVALSVAIVASLSLAGCGRKGPLELPPGTPEDPVTRAIDAAEHNSTQPTAAPRPGNTAEAKVGPVVENPGLIQPPNKTYQVPAAEKLKQAVSTPAPPPINHPPGPQPGKPFALDPLL